MYQKHYGIQLCNTHLCARAGRLCSKADGGYCRGSRAVYTGNNRFIRGCHICFGICSKSCCKVHKTVKAALERENVERIRIFESEFSRHFLTFRRTLHSDEKIFYFSRLLLSFMCRYYFGGYCGDYETPTNDDPEECKRRI